MKGYFIEFNDTLLTKPNLLKEKVTIDILLFAWLKCLGEFHSLQLMDI